MWPFAKRVKHRELYRNEVPAITPLMGDVPGHWPNVVIGDLASGELYQAFNLMRFTSGVGKVFASSELRILESDATLLTDEGVLEVPLRVADREQIYEVFFYPEPTPEAAAHYQAIKALAHRTRLINPVYYSTGLLGQKVTAPLPNVARNDYLFLEPCPEYYPEDHYALWWPEHDTHHFENSPAYRYLDEAYKQIEGIESYIAAHIARRVELVDPNQPLTRMSLPEAELKGAARGPERVSMMVSVSKEKGIRFHFSVEHTDPIYRDRFLRLWLEHIKYMRQAIEERNLPLDIPGAERSLDWWNFFKKTMRQHENEASWKAQALGVIQG
jgi:hypothetical protein